MGSGALQGSRDIRDQRTKSGRSDQFEDQKKMGMPRRKSRKSRRKSRKSRKEVKEVEGSQGSQQGSPARVT